MTLQRFTVFCVCAIGIGWVGMLLIVSGHRDDAETVFRDPRDRTTVILAHVKGQVSERLANHEPFPSSLRDLPSLPESVLRDAWGREIQLERTGSHYAVRSAGPDGHFKTSDDLVVEGSIGVP
jgi:hypothetical protein